MKSVLSILTLMLVTSTQSHAADVAVSQTFSPVSYYSKSGAYGGDGGYAVYTSQLTVKSASVVIDPSYAACNSAALNSLFHGSRFTISGMATCGYQTGAATKTKGISVTGWVCTYSSATCTNQ